MRNRTVEIADRSGHSFKLQISTASNMGRVQLEWMGDTKRVLLRVTGSNVDYYANMSGSYPGGWKTVEKGFLRYNNGTLATSANSATVTTRNIYLFNMDQTWGIQLFDYEDALGVNDEGAGYVVQPWVLGFDTGKFSWSVVD